LQWLPGALISVVALFAVFRLANWSDLQLAFASIRPLNLTIAIVLTIISLFTRALAWWTILERKSTVPRAFFIINEGYLLNNLFPFRLGELARAIFMGNASGQGTFHVLSTIVIERALDIIMAAGLLLATLPLALGMDWAGPFAWRILVLVLLGLSALYLLARHHEAVQAWVIKVGSKNRLVDRWVVPRIGSLLDGLAVMRQPRKFLQSVFWIVVSWVIWVLIYYVMLLPIAPQAKYWWSMFIDSVLALGIAVPSAPAALGVFEAALVGALTLLGVNASAALAYAIAMHFLQFVVTGIFGFWGLIRDGRSLSTLFQDVQAQSKAINEVDSHPSGEAHDPVDL
jgi:hypothetical protein